MPADGALQQPSRNRSKRSENPQLGYIQQQPQNRRFGLPDLDESGVAFQKWRFAG
jgi:hypothetical protein